MANIIVNASTSLVNINTSNIPLTSSAVVLLSSVNAPGAIITIRDYAGLASTNRKIIISTTSDTQFLDGPQISSFEIVTPYGFFTVSPRDTSIWTVLNSFSFGSQPNASVSSLTSGVITSSNIFNSNTLSTPVTNTSTLIVGYRGIRAVQEGYDVLSTMVFTSSGNVGVYTSTPAAKLHVVGNTFLDQQSTLRFAGGQDGAGNSNLRYSYDGINWSNVTSGDFGTTALDFAYNGSNRWVGVGSNGGTTGNIKYSGDGITWTNATYTSGGETGIRSVAWNGQIFLANGGAGGILYTSSDGITWTNSFPFPFTTGFCIAWNGQYWLAGGLTPSLTRTGSIARSTDGVTWTQNASGGFSAGCASLDWNGSYWVAVGSDTTAANRIQFSTDGLNWTNATSGYTNLTNGNSVHWNGSIWLAGGTASSSNDSLRYSTDGRVWLSSISRLTTVRGITWDGTKWILTGSTSSGSNLLYSFTGTGSWTNAGTRGNFNTTGNGVFMTITPSLRASNLELHTQNIPSYTTSTNKVYAFPSSLSLNDVLTVQNPGVNASNVGINTKTPSYTLDVNGSINFSTIFMNGSPAILVNSSTFNVSSLTVSTILPQTAGRTITIPTTVQASTLLASTMGVGVSPTQGTVEIAGTNASAEVVALYLRNNSTPTSNIVTMGFGAQTTSVIGQAQIAVGNVGSAGAGYMAFRTYGTSMTERMRITSTGNVGINTTTPFYTLDINGTGRSVSSFFITGQNNSTIFLSLGPAPSAINPDYTAQIQSCNDFANNFGSQLSFWTHGNASGNVTRAMTITNTQNVGIGTSSPQATLDVVGNVQITKGGASASNSYGTTDTLVLNSGGNAYTGSVASLLFTAATASYPLARIIGQDVQPTFGQTYLGDLVFQTNFNAFLYERMRIRWDGNVGIGTTNPLSALHVRGTGAGIVYLENSSATGNASFDFVTNTPGYVGSFGYGNASSDSGSVFRDCFWMYHLDKDFKFIGSGATERVRVTSGGRVGIGISTPTFQLQLSTDSAAKPGTNTWTISSDERLKENIAYADLDICYSNIKNIPLKRYTWRDTIYTKKEVPDRTKLGWIAQDVEKVFPKAVNYTSSFGYDDCRNLNSDQIYAALFGAVQKVIQLQEVHESTIYILHEKTISTQKGYEVEFSTNKGIQLIRQKRDQCLRDTDYIMTVDFFNTVRNRDEWIGYRQALRDFPEEIKTIVWIVPGETINWDATGFPKAPPIIKYT